MSDYSTYIRGRSEGNQVAVLTCPSCRKLLDLSVSGVRCSVCDVCYDDHGVINLLDDPTKRTALEDVDYDQRAGYNDSMFRQIGLQWKAVFDVAKIDVDGKDLLEIGAGTGALTLAILHSFSPRKVFATDISIQFLQLALNRAEGDQRLIAVRCDCNDLPVLDGSIDIIVGRSILHHLIDYDKVLKQCARILRPGGTAIFFEPLISGKLVIAFYSAMIIELARQEIKSSTQDKHRNLTEDDLLVLEKLLRHITKAAWLPQDREALLKLEDKYIFEREQMIEVGRRAGFSKVEILNDSRPKDNSYWSNFLGTIRIAGIEPSKCEPYRFIAESYARTFGLFEDFSHPPMVYFSFIK